VDGTLNLTEPEIDQHIAVVLVLRLGIKQEIAGLDISVHVAIAGEFVDALEQSVDVLHGVGLVQSVDIRAEWSMRKIVHHDRERAGGAVDEHSLNGGEVVHCFELE